MPLNEVLTDLGAASGLLWATVVAKAIGYLGGLYGAGALLFLAAFPNTPDDIEHRCLRRAAGWAAAGALAAGLAIPLQAAFLGGGWSMGLDAVLLGLVANSPLATSAAIRAVGAILIIAALLAWPRKRPALVVGVVGGLIYLAGITMVGHVTSEETANLGQFVLLLHLAAGAFWLGSLAPLDWTCERQPVGEVAEIMTRFGRVAAYVVLVLIAAGLVVAALLLSSPEALLNTTYGALLFTKLALVAGLLLLAARHKWRLVPELSRAGATTKRLRRSIRRERWLAAYVVVATAVLTTLAGPP